MTMRLTLMASNGVDAKSKQFLAHARDYNCATKLIIPYHQRS